MLNKVNKRRTMASNRRGGLDRHARSCQQWLNKQQGMAAAFEANVFVPLTKGSAGTWLLRVKKKIYINVYWKENDAAAFWRQGKGTVCVRQPVLNVSALGFYRAEIHANLCLHSVSRPRSPPKRLRGDALLHPRRKRRRSLRRQIRRRGRSKGGEQSSMWREVSEWNVHMHVLCVFAWVIKPGGAGEPERGRPTRFKGSRALTAAPSIAINYSCASTPELSSGAAAIISRWWSAVTLLHEKKIKKKNRHTSCSWKVNRRPRCLAPPSTSC